MGFVPSLPEVAPPCQEIPAGGLSWQFAWVPASWHLQGWRTEGTVRKGKAGGRRRTLAHSLRTSLVRCQGDRSAGQVLSPKGFWMGGGRATEPHRSHSRKASVRAVRAADLHHGHPKGSPPGAFALLPPTPPSRAPWGGTGGAGSGAAAVSTPRSLIPDAPVLEKTRRGGRVCFRQWDSRARHGWGPFSWRGQGH